MFLKIFSIFISFQNINKAHTKKEIPLKVWKNIGITLEYCTFLYDTFLPVVVNHYTGFQVMPQTKKKYGELPDG